MALNASQEPKCSGLKQESLEAGNYIGRLVQVLDLGLQNQRPFQGKEKPPKHEVMLGYELGTEFMKDDEGNELKDKPRWMSERIPLNNLDADLAKSTKRIKVFDPSNKFNGDLTKMVSAPVTITVVNNESGGNVYNNVGNITPPMKGFPVPELVNPPKVFDLDEPDMEIFGSLPEWVQTVIKENLNYRGSVLEGLIEGKSDEKQEPSQEEQQSNDEPDGSDDVWD